MPRKKERPSLKETDLAQMRGGVEPFDPNRSGSAAHQSRGFEARTSAAARAASHAPPGDDAATDHHRDSFDPQRQRPSPSFTFSPKTTKYDLKREISFGWTSELTKILRFARQDLIKHPDLEGLKDVVREHLEFLESQPRTFLSLFRSLFSALFRLNTPTRVLKNAQKLIERARVDQQNSLNELYYLLDHRNFPDMDRVNQLLKGLPRFKQYDTRAQEYLQHAGRQNNLNLLTSLANAGAHFIGNDNSTANLLCVAATKNHVDLINTLVSAGVHPNYPNSSGATALHFAAQYNNTAAIRQLVNAGASVDAVDRFGRTPLTYVVDQGNLEAMDYLIQSGASLAFVPRLNLLRANELLFKSAQSGSANAVRAALAAGADINAKDASGRTAYKIAEASATPNSDLLKILRQAEREAAAKESTASKAAAAASTAAPASTAAADKKTAATREGDANMAAAEKAEAEADAKSPFKRGLPPHEMLGISQDASPDEIKKAWRKLVARYHPDKHKGELWAKKAFERLNVARDTMLEPTGLPYKNRKFRKS